MVYEVAAAHSLHLGGRGPPDLLSHHKPRALFSTEEISCKRFERQRLSAFLGPSTVENRQNVPLGFGLALLPGRVEGLLFGEAVVPNFSALRQ
jgi:hypothetical protein